MKTVNLLSMSGPIRQLIYSPKGEIEGLLIEHEQRLVQLVVRKGDDDTASMLAHAAPGQTVAVKARPAAPDKAAKSEHPVFEDLALETIDGHVPSLAEGADDAAYAGRVVALNYARHGEANGVVLDTGDFIHLKPDGMRRFKLRVGDAVKANGDAQRMTNDQGWAVEATEINGKAVRPH